MKTRIWLVVIVAVLLLGLVGWTASGQRQQRPAQTWEYKVVFAPGARTMSEKMMNDLGAQGWEFVAFQEVNREGGTIGAGNYFFKRARTGQP
ncbi:MAG TPA: DUF4177 domain-containing protein [Pyrinomonadaceae bacterium]